MENYEIVLQVILFLIFLFSSYIFKYYHVFMYLQCPRGTVAVIYGFIVSPNNLYKGLNMAPRHDADDKSNPKSSAID